MYNWTISWSLTNYHINNIWLVRGVYLSTFHYRDAIMSATESQITGVRIVYSTVFFRHRSCEKTGEFPAQRASYAGNVSIWWRHHVSKSKMTFKMAASTKDSKWWAFLVTSSPISVIFLSLYGFFLGFSGNILGNIWIPNRDDMSIREYFGSTYQWKCSWKWQNMILMYWNNLHCRLTFEIIA